VQPTETPPVLTPRDPEIEILGKVVRVFLRAARAVLALVGAIVIAGSIYVVLHPETVMSEQEPIPPLPALVAFNLVWWCLGIPFLLPVKFLFGRGRWPLLVVGGALWFGPMLLEGDHSYGYLIRFFASLVAVSVLFVWKSVFALTRATP
jgi:hypothetical protein